MFQKVNNVFFERSKNIYIAVQKFGISKIFLFLIYSAHQSCIYLIKNTEESVKLWKIIAISDTGFLF